VLARAMQDTWIDDPRTVALFERIEELEFELKEARGGEGGDASMFQRPWGIVLPQQPVRIVHILAARAPKFLTDEAIVYALHGESEVHPKLIHVQVSHARRFLKKLGLRIDRVWGNGYYMGARDAALWRFWAAGTARGDEPPVDYPLAVSFVDGRWVEASPEPGSCGGEAGAEPANRAKGAQAS